VSETDVSFVKSELDSLTLLDWVSFVCEPDSDNPIGCNKSRCECCGPSSCKLNSGAMLATHMSAHILFDPHVHSNREPCGYCLHLDSTCQTYLVEKWSANQDGQKIDLKSTSCPKIPQISYKVAAEYKKKPPCTNVPVYCPLCPDRAAAMWKYNPEAHMRHIHPDACTEKYESLWHVSTTERAGMQTIWDRICNPRASKGKKKKKVLKILEGHSSCLALRLVWFNLLFFIAR
jgi:hypothetical protein